MQNECIFRTGDRLGSGLFLTVRVLQLIITVQKNKTSLNMALVNYTQREKTAERKGLYPILKRLN